MSFIDFKTKTTIKDRGEKHILRELASIGTGVSITTGIHELEGRSLPRFRGTLDGLVPIIQYAAWQEFGNATNVPRPFLEPTVREKADTFERNTIAGMRKIYNGSGTVKDLLTKGGMSTKRWVKGKIISLKKPANTPKTKRQKKRLGRGTNPLVFSGSMHRSITARQHYPGKLKSIGGGAKLGRMIAKAEKGMRGLKP